MVGAPRPRRGRCAGGGEHLGIVCGEGRARLATCIGPARNRAVRYARWDGRGSRCGSAVFCVSVFLGAAKQTMGRRGWVSMIAIEKPAWPTPRHRTLRGRQRRIRAASVRAAPGQTLRRRRSTKLRPITMSPPLTTRVLLVVRRTSLATAFVSIRSRTRETAVAAAVRAPSVSSVRPANAGSRVSVAPLSAATAV